MGVLGLSKLIDDEAADAIKEQDVKAYFGRRIAIDASMSLYQFLIAIRYQANPLMNDAGETTSHINGFFYRTCRMLENGIKPVYVFDGKPPTMKNDVLSKRRERQNDAIKAMKNLESGDSGTSEEEKSLEAGKLSKKKNNVQDIYSQVKLLDFQEGYSQSSQSQCSSSQSSKVSSSQEAEKLAKQSIRVNKKHVDDVKKLLKLMGVPFVDAPSEAEAQCAQLCKEGLTYGVATEDMDALTFGAPKMIRHLSQNTNDRIREIDLATVLRGFELTQDEFIDLCILMGCDYCPSIRGIGPKKGLQLIREFKSIEKVLVEKFGITDYEENLKQQVVATISNSSSSATESDDTDTVVKNLVDLMERSSVSSNEEKVSPKKKTKKAAVKPKKAPKSSNVDHVPKDWKFQAARKLFQKPVVLEGTIKENDLKVRTMDEEGLIKFLCDDNQFEEERIRTAIKRVNGAKGKASQTRIDSFFKVVRKPNSPAKNLMAETKSSKKQVVKAAGRGRKAK